MPILEIQQSFGDDYYYIEVSNVGIGPAKIESVYIRYRDTVYAMGLHPFIQLYINPDPGNEVPIRGYTYSDIYAGTVIPINGKVLHISANSEETASRMKAVFFQTAERQGLSMAVTYTSIYEDETWTSYLNRPFVIPPEEEIVELPE